MTNSIRWVLFLIGIAVLIVCVHYILMPLWPSYPMMDWGHRHSGPRTFPWGSFIGLLTIFGVGFILYKLFFPSSGSTREEEDVCPCCGREFEKSDAVTQESSSKPIIQKG